MSGRVVFINQVWQLARRSVIRTLRQPAQIIPALAFPLFLLAINTSGLNAATRLPGFPTDSYLNFALAVPFMQGALFAAINVGTDLARDVETGFLNRLSLTPVSSYALLAGQLGGALVLGILQSTVYLSVGLLSGAQLAAGFGGGILLIMLGTAFAFAFGAIGATIALRTGSAEAVQGVFPLLFVFMFLSSMSLPRPLIAQAWFRTVATYNPVSYLIEAVRSLIITGWDGRVLLYGLLVITGVTTVGIVGASLALKGRLART